MERCDHLEMSWEKFISKDKTIWVCLNCYRVVKMFKGGLGLLLSTYKEALGKVIPRSKWDD